MRITRLVTRRNSTARNSVKVSTEITVITLLGKPGQVKPKRLAEEGDVRREQQHHGKQAEVVAVAERLARTGAADEFRVRPGARAHRHQPAAQGFRAARRAAC